jgi:hypothetical protein
LGAGCSVMEDSPVSLNERQRERGSSADADCVRAIQNRGIARSSNGKTCKKISFGGAQEIEEAEANEDYTLYDHKESSNSISGGTLKHQSSVGAARQGSHGALSMSGFGQHHEEEHKAAGLQAPMSSPLKRSRKNE